MKFRQYQFVQRSLTREVFFVFLLHRLVGARCPYCLLFLASPAAHAQYKINGVSYKPTEPHETLTAAFTVPDGGVTTNGYSGYVLLNVTGVGQAYSTVYNDAFYLYTDQYANPPVNGHDGAYYQIAFDTVPLHSANFSRNVKNYIYGSLPVYNPLHDYTVILNTGLSRLGPLHFGVSDAGYSDNTGAYTVRVTQLAVTPEPSVAATVFAGLAAGASVLAGCRRRRAIA